MPVRRHDGHAVPGDRRVMAFRWRDRLTPTLALLPVIGIAALLRLWQLDQNGFGTPYYAAAVRSMSLGWHNFFFAAFDPLGVLAIDKPPVASWLQTGAVKILGYGWLGLHLPQVLEGLATVVILFHLVRRGFGPRAGWIAALFLAISPISVAVDRSNNTDSCLVLLQVLAAWPLMLAARHAPLRWLLLSAAILGVSFNVKMIAALLVLPAFVAFYLVSVSISWPRRFGHLGCAAVVLSAVALSWPVAVELTPPDQRPYVDSTYRNSMLELVVGHNAFDRFVRPAWLTTLRPAVSRTPVAPAGSFRLADPHLASQFLFLLPLVVPGLVLCRNWGARVLWGGWALSCGAVFSLAGGIFLPCYMSTMTPAIAALAAIGIARLRDRTGFLACLGAALAWQVFIILEDGSDWRISLAIAAAAIVVTGMALRCLPSRWWQRIGMIVGLAGLLAAPFVWCLGVVLIRGNVVSSSARMPDIGMLSGGRGSSNPAFDGLGNRTRLMTYLDAHHDDARVFLATTSILEAATIIIRSGRPAIALGGYTGSTPVVTRDDLVRWVERGEVRFVLIDGRAQSDINSPLQPLVSWVRDNGQEINRSLWRPPAPRERTDDTVVQRRIEYLSGLRLYDLAPTPAAGGPQTGRQ